MKLTIQKQELNESIQHVSKAINHRTTMPILSGIKLDAAEEGLTLTASDTEISIQSFIPTETEDETIIQLEQSGSVVLPSKFFVEIIRKLPENDVEIEVNEQLQTTLRSGATEIQMLGLDAEEFPVLPLVQENQLIKVPSDVLKSMIRRTIFAASTNESNAILTGILCTLEKNNLKFISTDRHRLASCQVSLDDHYEQSFRNIVISAKIMNELYKILPESSELIQVVIADNQVLFKINHILLYTLILDGIYPDTSKIIPQNYKTELVLETKSFLNAVDRAYLLSREERTNIVNLITHDDGQIEIYSSHSDVGKLTEMCNVKEMTGEKLKISFNSKYMLDALKVIESETIHIGFIGSMSPIIVRPKDHDQALHLILPYRTAN